MNLGFFIAAKLHGIRVTDASVDYHGSVTIDQLLMNAVGIRHGEQVHVVNLATGARWTTYALPGEVGQFTLNGGSARLGEIGDACVVMSYAMAERAPGASIAFLGEDNQVVDVTEYPTG